MFVKNLININKKDILLAGGKGASLGEMLQNYIPVPSGFVVLSTAFDSFILQSNIKDKIVTILSTINYESNDEIEQSSNSIANLILNANIPQNIIDEIFALYYNLKLDYVAVRSSATEEDGVLNAWAGQLDTFLNTDKSNLILNIKKCWCSLYNPRAIIYRKEHNLENHEISLAVVIQKMIPSEISGICFTANPLTNNRSQMVIEAGLGLGEAIVGGLITPDTYILNKGLDNSFTIFSKKISTQTKQLIRKENSVSEIDVPKHCQNIQKLNDINILSLSNISYILEKHYNCPQDIEWCFVENKFFVLQSRPITTLKNYYNKNKLVSYIKNQEWSFGIKAHESLLFYSAKQQGYRTYMSKEFFKENFVESLFITLKNDYPMRLSNRIQEDNFYKKAEEKILNTPHIILMYIEKNEETWKKISYLSKELLIAITSGNNDYSKKIFIDILKSYGLASTFFNIIFALGLKLTENKSNLKNIDNILTVHDNWRNSISSKEEDMGETIFLFLENLISTMKLTCSPIDLMRYLTLKEITKLLKDTMEIEQLHKIIENRQKDGYIYINMHSFNRNIIHNKSILSEIKNYFLDIKISQNIAVKDGLLEGQVTYKSDQKIKGKVLIIKDKDELKTKGSLADNKILVAIQTTPQYIAYLRNVKAIITDEGGITCHAAIISRELKKPCIVGTTHATKLLKDNDYIELDLNTGKIQILSI